MQTPTLVILIRKWNMIIQSSQFVIHLQNPPCPRYKDEIFKWKANHKTKSTQHFAPIQLINVWILHFYYRNICVNCVTTSCAHSHATKLLHALYTLLIFVAVNSIEVWHLSIRSVVTKQFKFPIELLFTWFCGSWLKRGCS